MVTSELASGFELAWGRFEDACAKPDPAGAMHALFESVAWAGALRDRFIRDKRDVYIELQALLFVRNLAMHEGADVLDWVVAVPGAELGMLVLDESRLDLRPAWRGAWRSLPDLPKPKRKERRGEAEYERYLVGRDVGETLEAVVERLRSDLLIHRDHQKHRGAFEPRLSWPPQAQGR
jgi:hypothetical protein